jgi:hypothetical protein
MYRCLVWLWDKSRLITSHVIKPEGNQESIPLTVSFNPDDPNVILVTGKNLFRYLKLNSGNQV